MTEANQKKLTKFIRKMGENVARGLMSDTLARHLIGKERHRLMKSK